AAGGELKYWDTATGRLIFTIRGAVDVRSFALSPDGKFVATGYKNGTAEVWDLGSRQVSRSLAIKPSLSSIYSIAYSPDGTQVAAGVGKEINVWNVATGKTAARLQGHSSQVSKVVYSHDGARILSGSWDKKINLWDASTGTLIRTFQSRSLEVKFATMSPD